LSKEAMTATQEETKVPVQQGVGGADNGAKNQVPEGAGVGGADFVPSGDNKRPD